MPFGWGIMRARLKRYQYPCFEMIFPEEKENTESQAADCHVFFSRFAFDIGDPPRHQSPKHCRSRLLILNAIIQDRRNVVATVSGSLATIAWNQ